MAAKNDAKETIKLADVKPAEEVKPVAPAAEEKKAAPKTEKKAAPKTEKKAAAKAPAKKTEKAAKAPAKAKTAKAEAPAKPSRKPAKKNSLTFDKVVDLAKKKVAAANLTLIKYPIAANVELSGACEGIFYICIKDGNIEVAPYKYNDYDIEFRVDAETIAKVFEGKLNIYEALANGDVKVTGIEKKAILFIHAAL